MEDSTNYANGRLLFRETLNLEGWAQMIEATPGRVICYNRGAKAYSALNASALRLYTWQKPVSEGAILQATRPLLRDTDASKVAPEHLRALKGRITTIGQQHSEKLKGPIGAIRRFFEKVGNWFDHGKFESHRQLAQRMGHEIDFLLLASGVRQEVESCKESLDQLTPTAEFNEESIGLITAIDNHRERITTRIADIERRLAEDQTLTPAMRDSLEAALRDARTEANTLDDFINRKLSRMRSAALRYFEDEGNQWSGELSSADKRRLRKQIDNFHAITQRLEAASSIAVKGKLKKRYQELDRALTANEAIPATASPRLRRAARKTQAPVKAKTATARRRGRRGRKRAPAPVRTIAPQPDTVSQPVREAERVIYDLVFNTGRLLAHTDPDEDTKAELVEWSQQQDPEAIQTTWAAADRDERRALLNSARATLGNYLQERDQDGPQPVREFITTYLERHGYQQEQIDGAFAQFNLDFPAALPAEPTQGAGLVNVGNTCYLNAELQLLRATPGMVETLRATARAEDAPEVTALRQQLLAIMEIMKTNNTVEGEVMRQFALLCEAAGWWGQVGHQQDSNEFGEWLTATLNLKPNTLIFRQRRIYSESDWADSITRQVDVDVASFPVLPKVKAAAERIRTIYDESDGEHPRGEALVAQLCQEGFSVPDASITVRRMERPKTTPTTSQIRRWRSVGKVKAADLLKWGTVQYTATTDSAPASKTTKQIERPQPYLWQRLNRYYSAEGLGAGAAKNTLPITLDRLEVETLDGPATYEPAAMVVHHGATRGSGHYTAVIKHDDKWYEYDDSATPKEVNIKNKRYSQNAYKIMWRRVE